MATKASTRQSKHVSFLRKLANQASFLSNGYTQLDNLLSATNSEVTPAFEMYPSNPLDRVLTVGANTVSNPETAVRHANSPINKQFPIFTTGTVTLPAASGGTIVVTPTITPNPTLIITANAFIKALVECDSLGNLSVTLGTEGASEALATFPGVNSKAFQIGLLIIQTVAGVVQNVTGARIIQFQGGGGSGTGSGSGVKQPIPGYQWMEEDTFDVLKTSTDSKVTTTNYTNATQNLGKDLYRLACDKSKTVNTNAGTAITLSGGAPSFTVVAGDIVYITSGARSGQWRRIATVNTQVDYVLDSAFTGGNAANGDTLMVSQAVWSKDLVNLGSASEKLRARDQFTGNITQIAVDYYDSLVTDDAFPDFVDTARIVLSAANDGLVSDVGVPTSDKFSPIFTRQPYPAQIDDYILSSAVNSARLFLAFFCNPTNGSVTASANLLGYEASFEVEDFVENGGTLDSAYCYTDATGVPVNCTVSTPAGFTEIELDWSYVPLVNPNTTAGQLRVFVDGDEIPRYVATSTLDAYYTEQPNAITGVYDTVRLHADLHLLNRSVEIIRSEGVVDTSNTNSTRIAALETPHVVKVNADYLVQPADDIVLVDVNGGLNVVITLPDASIARKKVKIVKFTTGVKNVIVTPTLSQTLDLSAYPTYTLSCPEDHIEIMPMTQFSVSFWKILEVRLETVFGERYIGSNQTVPNATDYSINFPGSVSHNTSTSGFGVAILYDGYYDIAGNLQWFPNGAGTRQLNIYVNGALYAGSSQLGTPDGSNQNQTGVSANIFLLSGDVVTMRAYQNSSGSLDLLAPNSRCNRFSVRRVGPVSQPV